MAAAKRNFHKAKENGQSAEDQTEVDRLDIILNNMDQFWKALSDACGSLQVGDELEIGDDRIAVVECSREGMMIHMYGRQQRHDPEAPLAGDQVPGGSLAQGHARLEGDCGHVFGDGQGRRSRPRRFLWEDAAKRGNRWAAIFCRELKVPTPGER